MSGSDSNERRRSFDKQLLEALLLLSRIPIQSFGDAVHPALALPSRGQDIGKGIPGG